MPKSIIAQGKTTNEAISNGLKELNVSRDMVNIKVLEEEKRSFFSILAPRVVKVEITLKEDEERKIYSSRHQFKPREFNVSEEEIAKVEQKVTKFLEEFIKGFDNLTYNIDIDKEKAFINVKIDGEDARVLIGYRGEVLNALQVILNSLTNQESHSRVKVILNVSNYKEKREQSLIELADKISKTVYKTGKTITLEPMMAYERKIIHTRLQSNNRVSTYSVGEEPYRKVVISKKYR